MPGGFGCVITGSVGAAGGGVAVVRILHDRQLRGVKQSKAWFALSDAAGGEAPCRVGVSNQAKDYWRLAREGRCCVTFATHKPLSHVGLSSADTQTHTSSGTTRSDFLWSRTAESDDLPRNTEEVAPSQFAACTAFSAKASLNLFLLWKSKSRPTVAMYTSYRSACDMKT